MLNFQNSQHKRQRKGREGFAFCIGMSLVSDKTSEPYTKSPPAPAPPPPPPLIRGKKNYHCNRSPLHFVYARYIGRYSIRQDDVS